MIGLVLNYWPLDGGAGGGFLLCQVGGMSQRATKSRHRARNWYFMEQQIYESSFLVEGDRKIDGDNFFRTEHM